MKTATLDALVALLATPGEVREAAIKVLSIEFNGAIEPQLPLQTKRSESVSTKRVKAFRERMKRVSETHETGSETFHETPALPLSSSPSLLSRSGNDSEKERESSSLVTREETGETFHETPSETRRMKRVSGNGERYVRLDETLTDELIAIAQQATVQDIESAWAKFTGYYADQWVHVNGTWKHWCVNEAKRERIERERQRERANSSANPLTAEGLDPSSYEASVARKKRRKAEEEAERAEVRARLEAQKASAQ